MISQYTLQNCPRANVINLRALTTPVTRIKVNLIFPWNNCVKMRKKVKTKYSFWLKYRPITKKLYDKNFIQWKTASEKLLNYQEKYFNAKFTFAVRKIFDVSTGLIVLCVRSKSDTFVVNNYLRFYSEI